MFLPGGAASEILLWVLQRGITNEECLSWYINSSVIKEETLCVSYYDNPSQSSCQVRFDLLLLMSIEVH